MSETALAGLEEDFRRPSLVRRSATPAANYAIGERLRIAPLAPRTRLLLRARASAVQTAGDALGFSIPLDACRAIVQGSRAALWLGPDEWMLTAPEEDGPALRRHLKSPQNAYALIDVSHRQAGFSIEGELAADVLNGACPLDLRLSRFGVDACARTLFGKAGVMLWRRTETRFEIETTRSFSPYVFALLKANALEWEAD